MRYQKIMLHTPTDSGDVGAAMQVVNDEQNACADRLNRFNRVATLGFSAEGDCEYYFPEIHVCRDLIAFDGRARRRHVQEGREYCIWL